METIRQSHLPILFLLVCGVLSWNYITNTGSTPDNSVNYNQNSVTRRTRRSDGSANSIHTTVKTTEKTPNGFPNSDKNTAAEMERTPYGSVNYNQDTFTRTKRSSAGSTHYNQNTVTKTEGISDGSFNYNHYTGTKMEGISDGSFNYDQNTVTKMEGISDGSFNYNHNTLQRRKGSLDGSINYNHNTVTKTEGISDGSINYNHNTVTKTEGISDGSINYNHNTVTKTEGISDGSAIYTKDDKRYRHEVFTSPLTTVNDGLSKGLTESDTNFSTEITNLKRNGTLDLLNVISTQSTMHLNTVQEFSRDPCHEIGTCSVTQNKTKWFCYCDKDCQMFNDCCNDYNGTIRNSNSQLSFGCYRQIYIVNSPGQTGFLAVDSCPDSYKNITVKERCLQNNFAENGLFVSNGKTLTFKNKFCALCNNVTDVQEFDIVFAAIEGDYNYILDMKKENKMTFFLNNANFKVIPPRNTNLRFCLTNLISTSNNNLCQSHSNPIFVRQLLKLYRNYFCLESNIANDMYSIECINEVFDMNSFSEQAFSMSILISLGNPTEGNTVENQCREWTVEIEQQGICSQFDVYTNINIDLIFTLISNKVIQKEIFHQIAVMVSFSYNTQNFTIRTSEFKIRIDENGLIATVRVKMIIQKSAFRHEIENIRKYFSERRVRVILKNDTYNHTIEILNTNYMPNNGTYVFISQQHEYRHHYMKSELLEIFLITE
ncbi:unnamed protein product [Mytilus edulis]|uniref:SMB domain-containing protein n=1 Tax=Mytilus edulis TaxID=6550 RepID=A0A8S3VIA5_MYTED|nr:unnamed protein product [Mytilus edulis]